MNKLKVAIATLVLIPLLIAGSRIYLNHVTENMSDMISEAEKSERDSHISEAVQELGSFNSAWGRHRQVIATFIRHAEIDLANQSAAKLIPLAEGKDGGQFYAECETLKMQLHHIADTERFSLENIL